jgi:hypothetical protein
MSMLAFLTSHLIAMIAYVATAWASRSTVSLSAASREITREPKSQDRTTWLNVDISLFALAYSKASLTMGVQITETLAMVVRGSAILVGDGWNWRVVEFNGQGFEDIFSDA